MKKKYTKQLSLGIDPVTGRRIRKRIYADTPTLLWQAEKQAYNEFEKKGNLKQTTFSEYAEKWFDTHCANLTYSTTYGYKNAYRKCKDLYNMRMHEITWSDLQDVINDNLDKPHTCKKIKIFFGSLFSTAVRDGVIQKSPAASLKVPRIPEKTDEENERRAFTPEEVEAIKKTSFAPKDQLLVNILYQFGLRPQEAFALNYEDFDIENKILHINKAIGYGEHEQPYIKPTKNYMTRQLPIPEEFIEKLQPWGDKGHIFLTDEGKLHTKSQADKLGQKICKAINIQMGGNDEDKKTDMTMYSFRHNKSTVLYYTSGISNKAKARYMGHSETVFLRIYSHLDKGKEDLSVLGKMT